MKQYDMVICIDNTAKGMINETINPVALNIDRFYKVLNDPEPYKDKEMQIVYIINDEGQKASYRVERFLTLQEWRQKQLERLLNG
jgi:hypothetical protein